MRAEPNTRLDEFRRVHPVGGATPPGSNMGFFVLKGIRVISSGVPDPGDPGWPWEHVSVSCPSRCPTWEEMCLVKSLFWEDNETVVQFHPPKSDYVNHHRFCLHLWKPVGMKIELPPKNLIA